MKYYFVEYSPFFDRDGLYGSSAGDYPDNAERFALFSRAVLEASKILGVPQIFTAMTGSRPSSPYSCARNTPRTRLS